MTAAELPVNPTWTGTITNDDNKPTVTIADSSGTEGTTTDGYVEFTVTLSAAAGVPVKVNYTTSDLAAPTPATSGVDYIPVTTDPVKFVTFAKSDNSGASNTEAKFRITTKADRTAEADETFQVELSLPADANATAGTKTTATGTIVSDDDPVLNIVNTNTNGTINEGDDVTFVVTLAGQITGNVTVLWSTLDGTAIQPHDYTTASGLLTFTEEVRSVPIAVSTINDNFDEVDQENFVVRLSAPNPASVGYLNQSVTINLNDNDVEPELSFGTLPTIYESDTTARMIQIPVQLNNASNKEITVDFAVSSGTAALTHDYTVVTSPAKLTFNVQDQEEFIEINIVPDLYFEDNETFTVKLSDATNASIETTASTGVSLTIINNDAPPVFTISSVEVTEGVDSGGEFVITQTPGSGKTVAVTATVANITATRGASDDFDITLTDFTGNSRLIEFIKSDTPAASETISIPFTIRDDDTNETTETFSITLSNPNPSANATIDANNKVGTATIYDNDTPPELSIAPTNAEIYESSDAEFTISANVIPATNFKFRYEVSQEGDFLASTVNTTEPQLANPSFTGSNGNYTTSLPIEINDDSNGEVTGAVEVILLASNSSSSEYTLGSSVSAEVMVYDDDLPELSIAGVGGPITEGSGDKATFRITSSYSISEISVRFRPLITGSNFLVGGIEGKDQELALNFNNTTTATLELAIDDDDVVEEDGTVQVKLLDDFHIPYMPTIPAANGLPEIPAVPANPIEYTVINDDTKNTSSVMVQDNDTLASIPTITLVTEFLPTGATMATFYVVADSAPAKDLEVTLEYNYQAENPDTDVGGNVNLFSTWKRTKVTIDAGDTYESYKQDTHFSAQITVPNSPTPVSITGSLMVRLVNSDNYNLGNPSESGLPVASTADNPVVSIHPVGNGHVVESAELKFEVIASPTPTRV